MKARIKATGEITMGFTTPCIIRKNTTKIRDRLKELGYYCNPYLGWHNLYTTIHGYASVYSMSDDDINVLSKKIDSFIDCGTNEELFLAIAALRDDTGENQWFVTDSPLSVSYDDDVGNDHYFTEPKGSVFFWDINWMHATIISGNYHKATVEELIEHFKGKGESMSNDFLGDMDRIGMDAYKQGEEDAKKRAIEILASVLENWVHGGDADCIIAEFEEELMKK